KVLSILIAMKATLDEVQSLLKSTGYTPLYVKNPFDCVIIYGICNNLSVININEVLYENNLELLE
ncbi:MAG: XRE family transcriptional regulator, partial [Clostridia bacterium]|nr:XRE family transcriptional regulator [Clostridia bacterium]